MSKGTSISGGTDGLYTVDGESVYCCDLSEDLSGSVGVIEIGGDAGNGKNLQPGYEGNAVYNAARDGEMFTVPQKDGAQPASGNFWNWSMRPGWQKFRHPYRYATISGLSGDTCTVTFEACYATDTPDGKQLDCNQVASMGATIEYMSCNGAAFEDGDEVVVELTHDANAVWSSAKVIGFKSEPKGCFWEPWGDALCDNHDWTFFDAEGATTLCPALPYSTLDSSLSITDGVLTYIHTGQAAENYSQLYWDFAVDDPRIDATNMILKLSALFTGPGTNNGIAVTIEGDTTWNFILANLSGRVGWPQYSYIGDNGGAEQTIDLAGKVTGTIKHVELWIRAQGVDPMTGTLNIDYINFT